MPDMSATLAGYGIASGYQDNKFYGDEPITRAEFVAIDRAFLRRVRGRRPGHHGPV